MTAIYRSAEWNSSIESRMCLLRETARGSAQPACNGRTPAHARRLYRE